MRAIVLTCFSMLVSTGMAFAHSSYRAGDASGVQISSLSHGEMAIVSEFRGPVLALAGSVAKTDETFRSLANYEAIQRTYCLWGIMPGSTKDEQSPFNECSHAYLSAVKELLLYMRDMPEVAEQADLLVSTIDGEAALRGVAFIGCQYSGETFNSAEVVTPHWENIASHPPTLLAFGGIAAAAAGATGLGVAAGRGVPKPKPA